MESGGGGVFFDNQTLFLLVAMFTQSAYVSFSFYQQ